MANTSTAVLLTINSQQASSYIMDRDGVESTSTTTSLADEPVSGSTKPIKMDPTIQSQCSSSIAATTTGLGVEEGSSTAPSATIVAHHHKNRRRGKRGKKGDSSFQSESTTGMQETSTLIEDDSLKKQSLPVETTINKVVDSKHGKKRDQQLVVKGDASGEDITSAHPKVESQVEADTSKNSIKTTGNNNNEEEDDHEESFNANNVSTNSGASSKSKRRRRWKKNGAADQSTQANQQQSNDNSEIKSVYRRVAEEQVETIVQKAFAQACWSLGIVLPAVTSNTTSTYSSQQRPMAASMSPSSAVMDEDLNFVSPSEMLMWDSALIKIVERAAHDPQSLESLVQNLAAALPEISLEVQQKNLLQQQQQQQQPYCSNPSSFPMVSGGSTPYYYSNNSGFVDGDSMDDSDGYYGGWHQHDHSLVDTLLQSPHPNTKKSPSLHSSSTTIGNNNPSHRSRPYHHRGYAGTAGGSKSWGSSSSLASLSLAVASAAVEEDTYPTSSSNGFSFGKDIPGSLSANWKAWDPERLSRVAMVVEMAEKERQRRISEREEMTWKERVDRAARIEWAIMALKRQNPPLNGDQHQYQQQAEAAKVAISNNSKNVSESIASSSLSTTGSIEKKQIAETNMSTSSDEMKPSSNVAESVVLCHLRGGSPTTQTNVERDDSKLSSSSTLSDTSLNVDKQPIDANGVVPEVEDAGGILSSPEKSDSIGKDREDRRSEGVKASKSASPVAHALSTNKKDEEEEERFNFDYEVICPYSVLGCDVTLRRSELPKHLEECAYRAEVMEAKRLALLRETYNPLDHIVVCPYSVAGCDFSCRRADLPAHLVSCPFKMERSTASHNSPYEVVCPNATLGCQVSCLRSQIGFHLQECKFRSKSRQEEEAERESNKQYAIEAEEEERSRRVMSNPHAHHSSQAQSQWMNPSSSDLEGLSLGQKKKSQKDLLHEQISSSANVSSKLRHVTLPPSKSSAVSMSKFNNNPFSVPLAIRRRDLKSVSSSTSTNAGNNNTSSTVASLVASESKSAVAASASLPAPPPPQSTSTSQQQQQHQKQQHKETRESRSGSFVVGGGGSGEWNQQLLHSSSFERETRRKERTSSFSGSSSMAALPRKERTSSISLSVSEQEYMKRKERTASFGFDYDLRNPSNRKSHHHVGIAASRSNSASASTVFDPPPMASMDPMRRSSSTAGPQQPVDPSSVRLVRSASLSLPVEGGGASDNDLLRTRRVSWVVQAAEIERMRMNEEMIAKTAVQNQAHMKTPPTSPQRKLLQGASSTSPSGVVEATSPQSILKQPRRGSKQADDESFSSEMHVKHADHSTQFAPSADMDDDDENENMESPPGRKKVVLEQVLRRQKLHNAVWYPAAELAFQGRRTHVHMFHSHMEQQTRLLHKALSDEIETFGRDCALWEMQCQQGVSLLVDKIRSKVVATWIRFVSPNPPSVHMFGSFASELSVPGVSDLDLVVVPGEDLQQAMGNNTSSSGATSSSAATTGATAGRATSPNQHQQPASPVVARSPSYASTSPRRFGTHPQVNNPNSNLGGFSLSNHSSKSKNNNNQLSPPRPVSSSSSSTYANKPGRSASLDSNASQTFHAATTSTAPNASLLTRLRQRPVPDSTSDAYIRTLMRDRLEAARRCRILGEALRECEFLQKVNVIDTALVPVISMETTTIEPRLDIDLTVALSNHDGIAAAEFVRMLRLRFPPLMPMVRILKAFLHSRNLANPFHGGLPSYALVLMATCSIIRSCERVGKRQAISLSQGELVLDFLDLFGREFDYRAEAVCCNWKADFDKLGMGRYVSSTDLPLLRIGKRSESLSGNLEVSLVVDDPIRFGNNVGRSCFAFHHVQQAFAEVLASLLQHVVKNEALGRSKSGFGGPISILQRVFGVKPIVPSLDQSHQLQSQTNEPTTGSQSG